MRENSDTAEMEGGDQDPDGVDTQANDKEEYHAGQTNSCMKN